LDWGGTQSEPSSGAKSAGYATGSRPTAQNWNFFLGNIDDWTKYLDEQRALMHLRHERTALSSVVSLANTLGQNPSAFAAGPTGRVVAVGAAGFVVKNGGTGLDDASYTTSALGSGSTRSMADVTHNGVVFCALGQDEIHTDADGVGTWTRRATGVPDRVFGDITFAPAGSGPDNIMVATYSDSGSGDAGWAVDTATDGTGFTFVDEAGWANAATRLCFDLTRSRFVGVNASSGLVYVNASPQALTGWTQVGNTGLSTVRAVHCLPNGTLVATASSGVKYSTNGGATWQAVSATSFGTTNHPFMCASEQALYAFGSGKPNMFASTDGVNFADENRAPFPTVVAGSTIHNVRYLVDPSRGVGAFFFGAGTDEIYRSQLVGR
jgi:hypothetical protein